MKREKVIKGLEEVDAYFYRMTEVCHHGDEATFCDLKEKVADALILLKEQEAEEERILKIVWDVLHSGVSTDTTADQDWVYEKIRNQVHPMY